MSAEKLLVHEFSDDELKELGSHIGGRIWDASYCDFIPMTQTRDEFIQTISLGYWVFVKRIPSVHYLDATDKFLKHLDEMTDSVVHLNNCLHKS